MKVDPVHKYLSELRKICIPNSSRAVALPDKGHRFVSVFCLPLGSGRPQESESAVSADVTFSPLCQVAPGTVRRRRRGLTRARRRPPCAFPRKARLHAWPVASSQEKSPESLEHSA